MAAVFIVSVVAPRDITPEKKRKEFGREEMNVKHEMKIEEEKGNKELKLSDKSMDC